MVATEFVAVVGRLLTRHGNAVGAMVYGERVHGVVPARTGRRHLLHLMRRVEGDGGAPAARAGGGTDLGVLLTAGAEAIRRRSLVFVVSDFISAPGWERPLARLAQRHEVVAIRIHDPLESRMPDLGLVVVQDAETGEQLFVDTHDRRFRERFERAAQRREASLRRSLAQAGVDTLEVSTADALADAIRRFADLRRQRSRLSGGGSMPNHLRPAGAGR
jgi:uncharacterized protein (DUF58 family)